MKRNEMKLCIFVQVFLYILLRLMTLYTSYVFLHVLFVHSGPREFARMPPAPIPYGAWRIVPKWCGGSTWRKRSMLGWFWFWMFEE